MRRDGSRRTTANTRGPQGLLCKEGLVSKLSKFTGVEKNRLEMVAKGYKFKIRFQVTDITCHCRNIWSSEPRERGTRAARAPSLSAEPKAR